MSWQIAVNAEYKGLQNADIRCLPYQRYWIVARRHMAMTKHDQIGSDELVFTAPLTINRKDVNSIRGEIQRLIEQVSGVVATTTPDTLACLNIDWVIIS